jgi:hypothetical protein
MQSVIRVWLLSIARRGVKRGRFFPKSRMMELGASDLCCGFGQSVAHEKLCHLAPTDLRLVVLTDADFKHANAKTLETIEPIVRELRRG